MQRSHESALTQFISTELNAPQTQAVKHDNGPILVIAGAGSGKTRVITARIAHLILEKGVAPSAIVALTFTNKAANEMKERIGKFLGNSRDLPFVGTFHSYCVRLLKANQELLETPFFSILDEDDQKKIVSGILTRNGLEKQISARNATYTISQIKNKLHNPDANVQDMFTLPFMYDVYQAYETEKKASHVLDFDDLLLTTLRLFKKNKTFKNQYQDRIQHILVDEYQDTNVVQHALLKQMARRNDQLVIDSICAVGDEDQSIYSWRGATIANMLNFQQDFPGTQIIKIEQNYRSVQSILDVANNVIEHNTQRNPKKLWSDKKGTDRIRLLQCVSEYQEADLIAAFASLSLNSSGRTGKEDSKNERPTFAVLYRTHTQSRAIEEALIKSSIPYKIIGGTQFYDRKEIKDLLAYMRLIINPFDRMALFRVVNTPARGLGLKFEEDLHMRWQQEPFLNHLDVAQKLIDEKIVTGKKMEAVQDFMRIFEGLTPDMRPAQALQDIIKRTSYLTYLKTEYDKEEAITRTENVKELIDAIQHFESQKIDTIEKFLDEVALMQEKMHAQDEESNKVLLMTLHAAKGLEFDNVILAGLEHGIIPSARSLDDDDALEEERRLFYVGITRAKERLLLSHVKYRYTYGKMVDQMPSQFLPEVPGHLVTKFDCSYWNPVQQRAFFAEWLNIKERSQVMTFGPKSSPSVRPDYVNPGHQARLTTPGKPEYKPATKASLPKVSGFRKNQLVHHEKYGPGLVQDVAENGDGTKYVTVKFKSSTKKILSDFLK